MRTPRPAAIAPPRSANELFDRITHHEGICGRLRHRRRVGYVAAGPQRRRRSGDLREEGGAGVDARVAPEGISPLAVDARAALAERQVRAHQLSGNQLLLGAEEEEVADEPRRSRSGSSANV